MIKNGKLFPVSRFLFLIHWCLHNAPAWILNVKEEGNFVLPLACCCLIKTNVIPRKPCFQEQNPVSKIFGIEIFISWFGHSRVRLTWHPTIYWRPGKSRWIQLKAIEIGRRYWHGDFKRQNNLGHSEHVQTIAGCFKNTGPAIHRMTIGGKLSQTPQTPTGTVATRWRQNLNQKCLNAK